MRYVQIQQPCKRVDPNTDACRTWFRMTFPEYELADHEETERNFRNHMYVEGWTRDPERPHVWTCPDCKGKGK